MPSISPSLIVYNIDLLQMLWRMSLLFAALAIAVALALILRRYVEDNRQQPRRLQRRDELEAILWGALASPIPISAESLPPLRRNDAMLVCDIALDILRPLRGEEAARIVKLLNEWPIRHHVSRMLRHGSRSWRIRMLTLLAHFDDAESLEILKHWMGHKDFYVQLAALRSLAARGAHEALPQILIHLIRTERQNSTMLADVLRRFGESALPALQLLTSRTAHLDVRLAAISALEAIASTQSLETLLELATDENGNIRAAAIAALGRIGDIRAEKAVSHALSDREECVRVRAAKSAGRLEIRQSAPILAAMLSDPSWWVRYRAAEALYRLGTIGQTYLQVRSKEHDHAGQIAAQVLAEKEAA